MNAYTIKISQKGGKHGIVKRKCNFRFIWNVFLASYSKCAYVRKSKKKQNKKTPVLIFDMLPVFLFKFKTGFLYGSLLLPLKKSQTILAKPSQNFKLFSQFGVTNSNFWKSKSTLWDYYELRMAPFSVAETSFHISLQSCMFCLFLHFAQHPAISGNRVAPCNRCILSF